VVKEYAHLLGHDPAYAGKAEKISAMTRDISEVIDMEHARLESLPAKKGRANRISSTLHPPARAEHQRRDRARARSRQDSS